MVPIFIVGFDMQIIDPFFPFVHAQRNYKLYGFSTFVQDRLYWIKKKDIDYISW